MLLQFPLTPAFAANVNLQAMDKDGNGLVDREEWISWVAAQARASGERPMKELMKVITHRVGDDWKETQGGCSGRGLQLKASASSTGLTGAARPVTAAC